jgi:sugar lactone lactonase YvrE
VHPSTASLATLLGFGVLALGCPTGASGGAGLIFDTCFANGGANSCQDARIDTLSGAAGVSVSPDGRSLYVAARRDQAVAVFDRDSAGSLALASCFANEGRNGCEDPADDALRFASGVSISPDGRSVYVTTDDEPRRASVLTFARAPSGALTYMGCISNRGSYGCDQPRRRSFPFIDSVAVSPDGDSVVVGGTNAITWFDRDKSGSLKYGGCIANRGAHGCLRAAKPSLTDIDGLTISPDGRSVYVGSLSGRWLTHLRRSPHGSLTYRGCFANKGVRGCRRPKHQTLQSTAGLAVSSDGKSLYAASENSLTRFERGRRGGLRFGGCWSDRSAPWQTGGTHGCRVVPHRALFAGVAVTVSPDGSSLYAASLVGPSLDGGPGALSAFRRAPNGRLRFVECYANRGARGCERLPSFAMSSPEALAMSPDGRSVYIGADTSLASFERQGASVVSLVEGD